MNEQSKQTKICISRRENQNETKNISVNDVLEADDYAFKVQAQSLVPDVVPESKQLKSKSGSNKPTKISQR